VNYRGTQS